MKRNPYEHVIVGHDIYKIVKGKLIHVKDRRSLSSDEAEEWIGVLAFSAVYARMSLYNELWGTDGMGNER